MARGKDSYHRPGFDEQGWVRRTHGVHTAHHKGGPSLMPKKGDSAPKKDPTPTKHHKPDNKEYTR